MNDLQKLIAEFQAKGGEVKKLPPAEKPKNLDKTGAERFFDRKTRGWMKMDPTKRKKLVEGGKL